MSAPSVRSRLRRAGLPLLALASCSAVAQPAGAPEVAPAPPPRAEAPAGPLRVPPLLAQATPVEVGTPPGSRLRFLSGVSVEAAHSLWGGLSGLEVDADGEGFVAISDRGVVFSGRLDRREGALVGVEALQAEPLRDEAGRPLRGEPADAEGLALTPGGALLVSFEGANRILRYERPGAEAKAVPAPRDFAALQKNSGLEALALSPEGWLAAIPERSGDEARPFPVHLRAPGGAWSEAALEREPPFLVTDAAFGPDGRLYVLERDFSLLGWFRARLRAAAFADGRMGEAETLATLSGVDNLEGLSLWRDPQGVTRLVLVSDDNFNPLQDTLILEFALEPPATEAIGEPSPQ